MRLTLTQTRLSQGHPRRRGEDGVDSLTRQTGPGSSPQARGGFGVASVSSCIIGVIPAGAGRISDRFHRVITPLGSSPQARGGYYSQCRLFARHGVIPAGAGRIHHGTASTVSTGGHPRMRGEHNVNASSVPLPSGSSPHARGTFRQIRASSASRGSSPHAQGTSNCFTA